MGQHPRSLFALTLVLSVLLPGAATAAPTSSPLAGPCATGAAYDSACDVDHDGDVDVMDVQLSAGHWNQAGTWMSDNDHDHLGQTWTGNGNPLTIGGTYSYPSAPLVLNNSSGNGLRIGSVSGDGVFVNTAGNDGVFVGTADNDGVHVEVADDDGVYVWWATHYGLHVGNAGNDGLWVQAASGVGAWANTTQASGQWGFYTPDKIRGSNVTLESLSLVAQVSGPDGLSAGDIVTAAGLADPLSGSTVHVPLVRLADGAATAVVGVVESRLALVEHGVSAQPDEGEAQGEPSPPELRSTDGPAQPGDYVALTIYGAVQVKVQNGEVLLPGQRVTVGADGAARALGTITVQLAGGEGTADMTESAPTLGVVLEAPKDGMVWVLVNPQ